MSYISVPYSFSTNSTFIAAQFNANYSAFVDGLSDGTKSLNQKNIDCTSLNATSNVSISSDAVLSLTLAVTSEAVFSANVTVNSTVNMNKINLGAYASATISDASAITASQSYMVVKTGTATTVTSISDSLSDGTLLILKKDPTSAASPIITDSATLILGETTRTLDNVNDVLVLQKQDDKWYEISFADNA